MTFRTLHRNNLMAAFSKSVSGRLIAERKRAKSQRRSIAAEVLELLERNFPTEKELRRRRDFVDKLRKLDAEIGRAHV